MGWHRDCTYMPVQAKGAVFCAEEVPTSVATPAGPTCGPPTTRSTRPSRRSRGSPPITRCTTARPSSATTKKADGEYSGYGFHDGPVPLRPLVKTHPETGRKSLLIGRHAHNIPGMDRGELGRPPPGARRLRLPAAAHLAPRLDRGDAVVWDNRCLLHQATPWDMTQPRIMWHSRIAGDPASEAALAA